MRDKIKKIRDKYKDELTLPEFEDIQVLLAEIERLDLLESGQLQSLQNVKAILVSDYVLPELVDKESKIVQTLLRHKILEEREACARIAEDAPVSKEGQIYRICQAIAKAIRARK